MANCRDCGIELTPENWRDCERKEHHHMCRDCANADRMRRYYAKHEYNLKYHREKYWRNRDNICAKKRERWRRYITSAGSGKILYGAKRPYPNPQRCELCAKENETLEYHHYDDDDLLKGLWLCRHCHRFAEDVDKGLPARYIALKSAVYGTIGVTDTMRGGIVPTLSLTTINS